MPRPRWRRFDEDVLEVQARLAQEGGEGREVEGEGHGAAGALGEEGLGGRRGPKRAPCSCSGVPTFWCASFS